MADQRPQPLKPASGPEKKIEVKRQIFVSEIRDGAHDSHWNAHFLRDGSQDGAFHVEADSACQIAYGTFLIGPPHNSGSRCNPADLRSHPGCSPDGKKSDLLVWRARTNPFTADLWSIVKDSNGVGSDNEISNLGGRQRTGKSRRQHQCPGSLAQYGLGNLSRAIRTDAGLNHAIEASVSFPCRTLHASKK